MAIERSGDIFMHVENPSNRLGWYEIRPKSYWTKWLLTDTTIMRKTLKLSGEDYVTIFEK